MTHEQALQAREVAREGVTAATNATDAIRQAVNDLKLPEGVEPIPKLKTDNPPVVSVHVPKVVVVEEEVAAVPTTEITGQAPAEAGTAAEGEKKEGGKEGAKEGGKEGAK